MFRDLWKQIPLFFKLFWVFSLVAGLSGTALVIVILYKLAMKL